MNVRQLKSWRRKLNLTQDKMAAFLNVHLRTYQRYEGGELEIPAWLVLEYIGLGDMRKQHSGHAKIPIDTTARMP